LLLPNLWKGGSQACVAAALLVSVFLYACVDKGNLFTYLGWVRLRHRLWWLYALTGGLLGALVVIWIVRVAGLSPGTDAPGKLLYGVTVGPIVEEVVFRGAAFSVIYVTASSISGLARWRTALSVTVSSLLFAFAHDDYRHSVAGVLWHGHVVRAPAVAIQFNCDRSSHARYIQRGDRIGDASGLVRFDRVSNLFYTFITHFQPPCQRGR
jgi:membrane protease YdiL (CAAX protease family)